jgi:hypothetical protein
MKSGIKERAEDAWAVHTQRFHEDEELALMSPGKDTDGNNSLGFV